MKNQFAQVKTRRTAKRRMPWAARIMKVCGGYIGYESITDYETAKKQK